MRTTPGPCFAHFGDPLPIASKENPMSKQLIWRGLLEPLEGRILLSADRLLGPATAPLGDLPIDVAPPMAATVASPVVVARSFARSASNVIPAADGTDSAPALPLPAVAGPDPIDLGATPPVISTTLSHPQSQALRGVMGHVSPGPIDRVAGPERLAVARRARVAPPRLVTKIEPPVLLSSPVSSQRPIHPAVLKAVPDTPGRGADLRLVDRVITIRTAHRFSTGGYQTKHRATTG